MPPQLLGTPRRNDVRQKQIADPSGYAPSQHKASGMLPRGFCVDPLHGFAECVGVWL
jgi:hypothetical protein